MYGICYIEFMTKSLEKWMENQFLKWQMEHGRSSLESFAKYLGISRGYVSQIMNGMRTSMSHERALQIAERLDNYSILDILGYALPGEKIPRNQLPPDLRERLDCAEEEVNRIFSDRGLTGEMPEAERVAIEIFEKWGFKYISTSDEEDGS